MIIRFTIATAQDCPYDCPYDLSPCSCYRSSNFDCQSLITCDNVSMADVAAVFQSKPAMNITRLILRIRPEGDAIPADLLGQSRLTNELMVYGPQNDPLLKVDPNAFRSSKNSSLNYVFLSNFDLSQMDFDFLADFPSVGTLIFDSLLNLDRSLQTLPFLPTLADLHFHYCSDMNKAFNNSVLKCNGLKKTDLYCKLLVI